MLKYNLRANKKLRYICFGSLEHKCTITKTELLKRRAQALSRTLINMCVLEYMRIIMTIKKTYFLSIFVLVNWIQVFEALSHHKPQSYRVGVESMLGLTLADACVPRANVHF